MCWTGAPDGESSRQEIIGDSGSSLSRCSDGGTHVDSAAREIAAGMSTSVAKIALQIRRTSTLSPRGIN